MSVPREAPLETSSTVLSTLAKLICRTFSDPAATAMFLRSAGMKLASVTRSE